MLAAAFPAVWMAYNYSLYHDPVRFLEIAGHVSSVHMRELSLGRRLLGWPLILVHYAPLPTVLLALAATIIAWRKRAARALLFAWVLTFLVFETRTAAGAFGTNETKYAMPLALMMMPQAAAELVRRLRGGAFLRFVVAGMMVVLVGLAAYVTVTDTRRFAVPEGAREQAQFLRNLPGDERVVIGTSLQGYLLVNADLFKRAVLADPDDRTGGMTAEGIAEDLADPTVAYLAYEYGNPVDFDPVLQLPVGHGEVQWRAFDLERVFLSTDRHFAVYRVRRSG
ncbi:MAG: hypothetical protein M5R36_13145 [Deltaproteobacteria bacterium]|nr:hypothetical protein [Deltaproteobacteria bacterium]